MVDQRGLLCFGFFFLLLFHFTFGQIQLQPLNSSTELSALFELRSSLGLRSKEWPRKVDPCSQWRGVTCENGRVIGINISGFRRTRVGRLNPQFSVQPLANLTLLQSFNASSFLLPGAIPDWFGSQLLSLKVLDLRSCFVNGAIPASLGNLRNLTSLYLSGNNLTGIIPDSLGQLFSLQVVNFSRNSLSGTIPISFVSLGNLSSIDVSANYLSGSIPPAIGALMRLQYLNLSGNGLMGSVPSQLGNLSSLVDLDLSFNSLTGGVPLELRGLRSLQRMILRNNNFTGDVPDALWSLPRLSYLDISDNNFTGMLPNSSSNQNVSTAAVLDISNNLFYGSLSPVIRRFSVIDLSRNYFEGKILDFMHNVSLNINCLQNVSNQRTAHECASFYTARGLVFDNFGRPNSTAPPPAESPRKSNRNKIILAGVLGGFGLLVILLLLLFLFLLCARKRRNSSQRGNGVGPAPTGSSPQPPGMSINFINVGDSFTMQQLLQATGDFGDANLIKHGHSGDLFNGVLESGIPVVIKRIDVRTAKKDSYLVELDFFSKISHMRFVPLLGHCLENENEKFLVYKHMPNGDLSNSLYYKKAASEDGTLQSLDWITRLKIATGAAEAISYMHHECNPPFVHRYF